MTTHEFHYTGLLDGQVRVSCCGCPGWTRTFEGGHTGGDWVELFNQVHGDRLAVIRLPLPGTGWQLRWGIVHFTRRSPWLRPGHTLTVAGRVVGFRTRRHGWIIMPLHRAAERRVEESTL